MTDPTPQEPLGTVDFAWDAIEKYSFEEPGRSGSEEACEMFARMMSWVWQGQCEDLNGLDCRATVVCWIFVPALRSYDMTEMAGRVGKKKQSLHRWTTDFKKAFPEVAKHLQHMRMT